MKRPPPLSVHKCLMSRVICVVCTTLKITFGFECCVLIPLFARERSQRIWHFRFVLFCLFNFVCGNKKKKNKNKCFHFCVVFRILKWTHEINQHKNRLLELESWRVNGIILWYADVLIGNDFCTGVSVYIYWCLMKLCELFSFYVRNFSRVIVGVWCHTLSTDMAVLTSTTYVARWTT